MASRMEMDDTVDKKSLTLLCPFMFSQYNVLDQTILNSVASPTPLEGRKQMDKHIE